MQKPHSIFLIVFLLLALAPRKDLDAQSFDQTSETIHNLFEKGIEYSLQSLAEYVGDRDGPLVDLLSSNTAVDSEVDKNQTALFQAATKGDFDLLEYLIDSGAELNHRDEFDATPIFYAASEGHIDVVQGLIKGGAELNLVDNYRGWTALMYASFEGNSEIVRILLDAGADLELTHDENENTALMQAAFQGFPRSVQVLVEAGADTSTRNRFGSNAADLAESRNFTELANLLMEIQHD